MIVLYLLAAHLTGDFLFQTRWQAVMKLTDAYVRLWHAITYTLAFVPVAVLCADDHVWLRAGGFLAWLLLFHYLTDSHRFRSTLGDVVQWRLDLRRDPLTCKREWLDHTLEHVGSSVQAIDVDDKAVRWPPPNPWPLTPLAVDQTLHVIQLAVLGGIFLT